MPKRILPLSDLQCRQAKYSADGGNRLRDGGGLYLELLPSGAKKWRMKYQKPGSKSENLLTFGDYPAVGLSTARERREAARAQLADGTDPALARDVARATVSEAARNTFRAVAEEWLKHRNDTWSAGYAQKTKQLLERDLYPDLGQHPIASITPAFLLTVARKIEKRGAYEMPRRALVTAGQIFQYAIGTGRATVDASAGMVAQLKPRPPVKHYPHVTDVQLPDLLQRIDRYTGRPETVAAVKLAVLTFIRGGELRYAEWSEFDFENAEWHVPSGRMKGRLWHKLSGTPHVVPLSRQAIALLEDLKQYTGHFALLFPGAVSVLKPVTGEAMNKVFHSIGFKGQQTVHGLRGLASTLLNESGLFDPRVIEAQLSHKESNQTIAAYNHAKYMPERRRVMQWWADFIDEHAAAKPVEAKAA
ncbi:integrase arm-type DNA-binding domain-containing protein [Cupriavidus pauculus]|uniref:tyrosine-type recombinase/integrase n=1 Tax=Cupriavidus pauculus TaxID=82633 RepID=UPI00203E1869|nr:integrase arm-type DNA-binding domain-containing protein [Cupriavidus pauculus]MCM3608077.1 integrase arm-type DNA-binding domain-containing protein [Cupriavidus pauculus]